MEENAGIVEEEIVDSVSRQSGSSKCRHLEAVFSSQVLVHPP
jgi:hypothetical protein